MPTSNPESGKRWNEAKVRNGQSLTSAPSECMSLWAPFPESSISADSSHRPTSPLSRPKVSRGHPQPHSRPAIVLYEVRGHVTHSDIL